MVCGCLFCVVLFGVCCRLIYICTVLDGCLCTVLLVGGGFCHKLFAFTDGERWILWYTRGDYKSFFFLKIEKVVCGLRSVYGRFVVVMGRGWLELSDDRWCLG